MADNKKIDEQQVQQGLIGSDPNAEVAEERKPTNVRVQKFLLLSARSFDIAKKDAKGRKTSEMEKVMQIFFLDGNQCIPKTGQPLLNGFAPVVSIFQRELTPEVMDLEEMQVFTPVFAKSAETKTSYSCTVFSQMRKSRCIVRLWVYFFKPPISSYTANTKRRIGFYISKARWCG